MHRSSSWRPPRRTAFAGRLGLLFCLLVLAFSATAGPATAYSCGARGDGREAKRVPPSVSTPVDCDQAPPRTTRRGNADPMSFVFYMGVLVAFVAVPLALSRREELSRK